MTQKEPTVQIEFGEVTLAASAEKTIGLEVTNVGRSPIDEIKVEWVYDYETPQDATENWVAQHSADFTRVTGQKAAKADEVGRRYSFNPAKGEKSGPLGVGEKRLYLYPPEWIPEMRSVVQALSPERYRVAITMNGKEEVAIPGNIFADFVQQRFGG